MAWYVYMDLVDPLARKHVSGRLAPSAESALRGDPALTRTAARALVLSNFQAATGLASSTGPRPLTGEVVRRLTVPPESPTLGFEVCTPVGAASRRRGRALGLS